MYELKKQKYLPTTMLRKKWKFQLNWSKRIKENVSFQEDILQ